MSEDRVNLNEPEAGTGGKQGDPSPDHVEIEGSWQDLQG